MTPEQKLAYLENPSRCPVCGSTEFWEDGESSYDGKNHWLHLRCNSCESCWTEEYVLHNVWIEEDA